MRMLDNILIMSCTENAVLILFIKIKEEKVNMFKSICLASQSNIYSH